MAEGFVAEDGGGNGNVQGIQPAEHRNHNLAVGSFSPDVGDAVRLASKGYGAGFPHVCSVVWDAVLELCGVDLGL